MIQIQCITKCAYTLIPYTTNVDAFKVDDKLSEVWNTLASKVSTPYVLVARDVFHFTWLTQLERQIRVISQIPNVGAVGGAYRNILGHWKAGCVQTTLSLTMSWNTRKAIITQKMSACTVITCRALSLPKQVC